MVAECTLKESAAINQILGRRVSVNKTVIIIVLVCIYIIYCYDYFKLYENYVRRAFV